MRALLVCALSSSLDQISRTTFWANGGCGHGTSNTRLFESGLGKLLVFVVRGEMHSASAAVVELWAPASSPFKPKRYYGHWRL